MDPACISAHASRITVMFNAVPVRPQNESFTGEIILPRHAPFFLENFSYKIKGEGR
jgi:hypothetical protein